MSDEKRFTKKKTIIEVSVFIAVCVLAGVLGICFMSVSNNYTDLSGDYDDLYIDYLELSINFNTLNDRYFILTGEHIELENDYNNLVIDLADMTSQRDALVIDLADMTLERDNLIIDLNNITTERDNLLANIEILDAVILVYIGIISDLYNQIDILDAEIEVLEGQSIVDNETIADLNAQIVGLQVIIDANDITIAGLQTIIDTRDATITDLNAQILTLETERDNLQINLDAMTDLRDGLQIELDVLNATYIALLDNYQILSDAKAELQTIYNALLIAYDYMCDTIRQSILPIQYSIFAEAVRRYYMDIYLEGLWELDEKEYWIAFAEFCRDIILHDSGQHNAFSEVSNAFSNVLTLGSDTMGLAEFMMTIIFDYSNTINYWGLDELYGLDELNISYTVIQDCIDNIDYEYDSIITLEQEYFDWDYIKFPVETAFRTMGDCEDQAILTSAYLESCGIETAIAISHDLAHPTRGAFYHGTLFVQVEDPIAFWSLYPTTYLWSIDGINAWCWVDTTWDVPFGSTPDWLQEYLDYNINFFSWDIITLSFCDIGGSAYTNTGENIGLTCVMPT